MEPSEDEGMKLPSKFWPLHCSTPSLRLALNFQHIENSKTLSLIDSEKFDAVVLQEQSQNPSLSDNSVCYWQGSESVTNEGLRRL